MLVQILRVTLEMERDLAVIGTGRHKRWWGLKDFGTRKSETCFQNSEEYNPKTCKEFGGHHT